MDIELDIVRCMLFNNDESRDRLCFLGAMLTVLE